MGNGRKTPTVTTRYTKATGTPQVDKELRDVTNRYNLLRRLDESLRVIKAGLEWTLQRLEDLEREYGPAPVRAPVKVTVKEDEVARLPWQFYDQGRTRGWLLSDHDRPTSRYELDGEQRDILRRLVEKIRREQPEAKAIFVGKYRVALAGDDDQFLRLTVRKAQRPSPSVVGKVAKWFPREIGELLVIEAGKDVVIVRPKRYLGGETFARVAEIVRHHGGEYCSAGRESYFRIPLSAVR